MEFKVTEEFIREAHGVACSTWKQRIEKEFSELFKTGLEVGKWYKNGGFGFERSLACVSHINPNEKHEFGGYGFDIYGRWFNNKDVTTFGSYNWIPATPEEVESALIAEAKKRGYVGKEIILIKGAIGTHSDVKMQENFSFEAYKNRLMCHCEIYGSFTIFADGKWAEILPEQKTIITKGKALRIIAKKLKVSPESIEIQ